ncbi:MAG: hypothetical protein PHZ13_06795, partial [bacterium]|nr:hypothetical protein [bacterium]
MRVGAKIADEKKVLLWGTEIPAGTIGKGELGIYAVVNMEGEITLVADLQLKSYKVLDIYLRGGMEGTIESDLTTLSADVGVRIKAGGKVISKKFTLMDEYYSLWKLQKPDMAGFLIGMEEVC